MDTSSDATYPKTSQRFSTKPLRHGSSSSSAPARVGSPSEASSQNESFAASSDSGMTSFTGVQVKPMGEREMRCGGLESGEAVRESEDHSLEREAEDDRMEMTLWSNAPEQ